MGKVRSVVPHTSGTKAVTSHSHLSPMMINHVAILASRKIARHARRKAYEEAQWQRRLDAMFHVQMEASSAHSVQTPEHREHLEKLAADFSQARDDEKEATRASKGTNVFTATVH